MLRTVAPIFCLVFCIASSAAAQERRPSHCIAIADAAPGITYLHKAAWTDPVEQYSVRLHYISHASFLLQTEDGLSAVTDFTGFVGNVDFLPDVVTMNNAHSTHWTANPDPGIPYVLKGWAENGVPADHHLDLGGMLVRNVPTDVRGAYSDTVREAGNSIFVFEAAGLCIGHLGHLHHVPTDEQFAAIGRLDVVMAPVDGGYTMSLPEMIEVMRRFKARIVIPMHWFADGSLSRFVAGMEDEFEVVQTGESHLDVSLRSLPDLPTVMVLRPSWLRSID
jgi:L-ascorbate metabolism protein UlaG (beta-lactamase superfamily)